MAGKTSTTITLASNKSSHPITLLEFQQKSIRELKNVGPKYEDAFARMGIFNLVQLLGYYPNRYLDRSNESTIRTMESGEEATVLCRVLKVAEPFRPRGRKLWIVKVDMADDEGTEFEVMFFNQRWRSKQLAEDMRLAIFGKLSLRGGKYQISHPVVDFVGDITGRIVPLYPVPKTERLYPHNFSNAIAETLSRSRKRGIADPLNLTIRKKYKLISRHEALEGVHQPESFAEVSRAKKRLAFDELLCMQLELLGRKKEMEKLKGVSHKTPSGKFELAEKFIRGLPYSLTGSQLRVIREIQEDLQKDAPMHRLLQGDVGSGKTIVALLAILSAIEAGHQAAFLVPTEVLAEQHYEVIRNLLHGIEVEDSKRLGASRSLEVNLLTNRITGPQRKQLLSDLKFGRADLAVGTSALIYEGVEFNSLGLVVVDEQHRFGVNQRALMREKSGKAAVPDSLSMTATPIPRTVAMTIYGDLDVSVLDELPPGRLPIKTQLVADKEADEKMWEHIRQLVAEGKQAYVVCPLIGEESPNGGEELSGEELDGDELDGEEMNQDARAGTEDGKPDNGWSSAIRFSFEGMENEAAPSLKLDPTVSVVQVYKQLSENQLKGLRLETMNGRMPFEKKDQIMNDFRDGKIDVLISTTVIEVGVDVPNAVVMAILGAYRFGIAQLHQLRGRVGRSNLQSYCYLVSDLSLERLDAVASTSDGFELAEKDLEFRREGTIMGNRQTGKSDLRAASLIKHRELVPMARAEAENLLSQGPLNAANPEWDAEVKFLLGEQEKTEYLMKS